MTTQATYTIVENNRRLSFFPNHLATAIAQGVSVTALEGIVYNLAGEHDSDYNGGYWEYAEIGDTFFMFPSEERNYSAKGCYDIVDDLTNVEFGIVITFLAVDRLMWGMHERRLDTDDIIDTWHKLKNALLDMNAQKLYPIID